MSSDHPATPSGPQASGPRSVAAGSIGVAITGDGARVVMLPPEAVRWAREVSAPPGAANLPGSASGVFVGRDQELKRLRGLLAREGEAAVTQAPSRTRAIHGLGGIGKSSLALHYAHEYRRDYTLVWWIAAESTEQIVTSLAALAVRLCPQWAGAVGVEERAAWAIVWLQWHPGWLLVFDNVEDPTDLRHYLGALADGHHLATSRKATGWHTIAPTMALGLMDPDASADLLCTLALGQGQSPTPEQRRQADDLAAEVGYLPLALEQVGAYLYQTGTDLGVYQQLLGRVLDRAADGTDPERTIARIWLHTLTAVQARDPLAVKLLQTIAWLAPDDIPRTLLAPLATDPIALGDALGVLHAYNMIAFTADRQGITVHRLVQMVLRTRATADPSTAAPGRQEAEQALKQAGPDADDAATEANTRWERLLPHVFALAESTSPSRPASTQAVGIYRAAAQYLFRQGRDAHSIPLHRAVLAQSEQALGDTHPDTLIIRNSLAGAYRAAGYLERAIALYESTLAQREQVLGDTHPDTLISRNSLAGAYEEAGDLERAIALYESTLAQREQVLGDTHPDTLISRNSLASAYEEAGDVERAIALFESTLAQRERKFGDTHRFTLNTRNNLALAYLTAGDLERAIPLFESTLAQRERVLGDIHPSTLTSRNNLALAYKAAGDLERAIALHESTLAQREQVLGDTHPRTLTSRINLAGTYRAAGHVERAIALYESTLTQSEQVLGDTHPDTLIIRNSLAGAYRAAGHVERAIALYESTLAQRERVLGDTHPSTLISRSNLAIAYEAAGDMKRALPLYESTLAQREQVLGDTHPDTLISRNSLAGTYLAAGDAKRAIPLFEATVAHREEALGGTHPDTLMTRNSLALAYRAAGDLERAIALYESTLALREQVLGDTHPSTLISRSNLAIAYEEAGDLERAIPLYESTLAQRERVLGDTHPSTLTSRNNLAGACRAAGDVERAIALYESTLALRERVLGGTHPDTLVTRNDLARARRTG
ncbi:tetratricopeptide repeat protein [Streptomyces sp. NPDC048275]|uniref:tetratricopeptide repeat protein n=1 Tax=Streptomyces sp. NPDC048275 TaxID=3155629 RepID=UPI0033EC9D4A